MMLTNRTTTVETQAHDHIVAGLADQENLSILDDDPASGDLPAAIDLDRGAAHR